MAPEILQGRYSSAADIFSLGLLMVEMAGNCLLPTSGEPWQKLRSNDLSEVPFEVSIGETLRAVIRDLLQAEPQKRPTALQIVQVADNWIKSHS